MIAWAAIEAALVAWVVAHTGRPAIWANQTGPQPEMPYSTLQVAGVPTIADELRFHPAPEDADPRDVEMEARGEHQMTVAINVYSRQGETFDPTKTALHLAQKVRASLGLPSVLEDLRDVGLSFIDATPIQDLTFLQDEAFIERRQMDVRFALASSVSEVVEGIATVEVAMDEGGP